MTVKKCKSLISLLLIGAIALITAFACPFGLYTARANDTNVVNRSPGVTLRVAFPIVEGITQYGNNGDRKGMVVDYLNEIANYTGWNYEYIGVDNAVDMLEKFREGEYDLMGGTYYVEDYKDIYGYPKYSAGYSKAVLLSRWSDDDITSHDISSLNGKKIGVYTGAVENIRKLRLYLDMNNVTCDIVEYKYSDFIDGKLYHYLESGAVDMLLGNAAEAGKKYKVVASFDSQPLYIVTQATNTEILNELNDALEKIYDTTPNFAETAFYANFPNVISANISLTKEEQEYIASGAVARIAVADNTHPLFCETDASQHNGILYDLMALIKQRTGLNYTYVKAKNFAHSNELVKNDDADVVGIYLDSLDIAASNNFALTGAYTDVTMMLLKNKTVTYPADNLKVAVVDGRYIPDEIDATVVTYPNITEALTAVNNGKADLAYGMTSLMEKVIQEKYLVNLVPVYLGENSAQVRFAVNRPANTYLFTILNKAVNMISDAEMLSIVNANVESLGSSFSFSDFIYNNPVVFIGIIVACFAVVIIIIGIFSIFKVRSVRMRAELEKYSADSRAKSEFLSRMSHEIRTPMNAVLGLTDVTLMKKDVPEDVVENLTKIHSSSNYLLSLLNDILDMSRIESGKLRIANEPFSLSDVMSEVESMMSSEATNRGLTLTVMNTVADDTFLGDSIRLRQVLTNLVYNAVKFTNSGGQVNVCASVSGSGIKFSVIDTGCGIAAEDKERIFSAFEQAGAQDAKKSGTGLGLPISRSIVRCMGGELELKSEVGVGSEFYFTIPLERTSIERRDDNETAALYGMTVLLAEDNDLNAEITQDILEMAGAKMVRAIDGEAAIGEFKSNSEKYDAILMDIQMPKLNGLEATEAIRALDIPRAKTVPIIAMTANSSQEDTAAAKAAGMSEFLSKPIDIKRLYAVLKKFGDNA